jgi:hypothetical protein
MELSLMIKIQGIDGGLLTIGEFDLLDNTLSLPCDVLVVIESGYYPIFEPRRILKSTNLRFRGEILYQSNKLQDHIMLPAHLQPDRAYGIYVVSLSKDDQDAIAYILADLDQNIAVISTSFYQLCRYAQDFELFKVNGILLNQSKAYSQQSPKLNLSEQLLGGSLAAHNFPANTLHDFEWGDEYTPSIVAHVDRGDITTVPFGEEHTGSLLGVGNFKTWRVTAFRDVPVNHLTNVRHLVIEVQVTQIAPRDLLCNTVTTPQYLDLLIDQHTANGSRLIHITSETRGGLPIYIVYNHEKDTIEECVITYSPQVLQDYINAKYQNYLVVNTVQESVDESTFEKQNRYENADVSFKSVLEDQHKEVAAETHQEPEPQQVQYADGEYNPDENVLNIQKSILQSEQDAERDRLLQSK